MILCGFHVIVREISVALNEAPVCKFYFWSATLDDVTFQSFEDALFFIYEAPPPHFYVLGGRI